MNRRNFFGKVLSGVAMIGLPLPIHKAAPKVPTFPDGGVFYGPTNALIGKGAIREGNPEVIAPLSKLKAMLEQQYTGLNNANRININ